MRRSDAATVLGPRAIVAAGLVVIALFVAGLVALWRTSTYDVWGGMVVAPILIAVTLPAFARQARREGDARLFWLLLAALIAKLLFSLLRYHFAFEVYDKADARGYHGAGAAMAEHFRAGDFRITTRTTAPGTRLIEIATAIVYTVIRPTVLGGFFVFSWLAFLGTFYFYRAFHLGVAGGRTRSYARLVFFLPSLLYWPASLGKEAWMMATLGIAAYGAARILSGHAGTGLIVAGAALWLATQVRPHYAGLLAISIAVGYLFRKPGKEWRQLAPIVKGVSLVVLAVISAVLVVRTQEFLGRETLSVGDVEDVLAQTSEQTQQGGSQFEPIDLMTPTGPPLAIFTVLFRPLIVEANNVAAAGAALEGTLLLGLCVARRRSIVTAFRRFRRTPYLAFAGSYALAGILVLSSIANFGILTRQRVLIYPAFLALLCVPGERRRQTSDERERHGGREEHALATSGA